MPTTLDAPDALGLLERAPGRRVALLDCAGEERASALAAAGWSVSGLDSCEARVAEARRVHGPDGWSVADLVRDEEWPLRRVDAALWVARGTVFERRRVLRRAHRHLARGGLLVVEGGVGDEPLLREAGFAIEAVDATAVAARSLARPPEALAVTDWGTPRAARLDLRYAPDETELLDVSPDDVWREALRAGAAAAAEYPVEDPWGGARGAPAVARFFQRELDPRQVTFSSGVSALLHDLAGLADGGPIVAPELVHPDLGARAAARGSTIAVVGEPAGRQEIVATARTSDAALVHLDRPGFCGGAVSLSDVERIAAAGVPVLVDESPAAYLGPAASAVQLVGRVDNLVVLRGFTKAYSWGGLRIGYAVASPAMARRVRELVAPMGASGPALAAATAMLAHGDVFAGLRRCIRRRKRTTVALLAEHGMTVLPSHPDVPWVAVRDPGGRTTARLDTAGIRGLHPVCAPGVGPPALEIVHLTIPLAQERLDLLRELLA